MRTLDEVFPHWMDGLGVFNCFTPMLSRIPWSGSLNRYLDMNYIGNHSGGKYISPLLDKLSPGEIDYQTGGQVANIILALNEERWNKLWATMEFRYDPISNYDMRETMTNDTTTTQYGKTDSRTLNLSHGKSGTDTHTPDITNSETNNLSHGKTGTESNAGNVQGTRTDNMTHGKTGTETRTDNLSETITPNRTKVEDTTTYGFNSSSGIPSNSVTTHETGTETKTNTGTQATQYNLTETDSGTVSNNEDTTNTVTYNLTETDTGTKSTRTTGTDRTAYDTTETDTGTDVNAQTGTDTHTRNYTLTRTGNIGVTTSQQMIESERDLWMWRFFEDIVFPDIDRILTLSVY